MTCTMKASLAAIVALSCACVAPVQATHVYGEYVAGSPSITIVNTGENALSSAVMASFLRNVKFPVNEFLMNTNTSPTAIAAGIRATKPSLLLALGGRAAAFAHAVLPESPLLYTLVLQDQSSGLNSDTVAGVALEMSPATEFSLYRIVLPQMKRVLTFYSEAHSTSLIKKARAELAQLGLELIAIPLPAASALQKTYELNKSKGDVVWILNDPLLMTQTSFTTLHSLTLAQKQPLLCSSFRQFAAAGAMMAASVDFSNIGAQLAGMANTFLWGAPIKSLGVRPPIGGQLILNLNTAEKIGVDIPARVYPLISEIMDSDTDNRSQD